MQRRSVEDCRAEIAQKGESFLTPGQLAYVLDRAKAGEQCSAIAASLGVSFLAVFASLCDWDLRRNGY